MKKLTTFQHNERDRLVKELADSEEGLEKAVRQHASDMDDANNRLVQVLERHNDVIHEINEFRDGVASDITDYISERSERWQEGEKGELYRAWEDAWHGDIDEVEIDLPDEIEEPELDAAQSLKDLPERPEDS